MGQKFGTITFCHLLKLIFLIFPIGHNVTVRVIQMTISKILADEPIKFHTISTEMGMETL